MRKRMKVLRAVLLLIDIACVTYTKRKRKREERDNA